MVYEVKIGDAVRFQSSDVRAIWSHIFETAQGNRLNYALPPLPYPATNITLGIINIIVHIIQNIFDERV